MRTLFTVAVLLSCLAQPLTGGTAGAQTLTDNGPSERWNSGWALYIDNDALALIGSDQQYTGGAALTLSGRRAQEYWFSLDPILGYLNRAFGLAAHRPGARQRELHAIEFGLTAFTPEEVDTTEPVFDDHPYGSVVFFGNTRQNVLLEEGTNYQSSFALGLLGTRIPQTIQDFIHDAAGQGRAQGWDNQISDGGEPTFK